MSINFIKENNLDEIFFHQMSKIKSKKLGLAVSGGGDSLALLILANRWAKNKKKELFVASVDHKLREESYKEINHVKNISKSLKIDFSILEIQNKIDGNIQSSARKERYNLLSNWAKSKELDIVLLGHNLDDQVETVFLRLFRGSGIDGLTGIFPQKVINDITFFRPLLKIPRSELRDFLQNLNIKWIEDKSNDDLKYDRIKIRKILKNFSKDFSIEKKRISQVTFHMQRAQFYLNENLIEQASKIVIFHPHGDVDIDIYEFKKINYEIQLRLISSLLLWISGKNYRSRFSHLEDFIKAICSPFFKSRTLMGVIAIKYKNKILMRRELDAIKNIKIIDLNSFKWESRWVLKINQKNLLQNLDNLTVQPIKNFSKNNIMFRDTKISQDVLKVSPGLFKNGRLICVPLIKHGKSLEIIKYPNFDSFIKILS